MSGNNLFVCKNGNIAFSDYFLKENLTLMKLSLEDFLSIENINFQIPLDSSSLASYNLKDNGQADTLVTANTVYNIRINNRGDIEQISALGNTYDIISYRSTNDSYFARSSKWSLETAASTGCLIYEDAGKIYEEAFYSCGMTPPPYYTISLDKLNKALSTIPLMLHLMIVKDQNPKGRKLTKKDTEKDLVKFYKTGDNLKKYLEYSRTHPKIAKEMKEIIIRTMGLQRHNDF